MEAMLFQSDAVNAYVRLDPRTKLFMLLVISTIMINGDINGAAVYIRPIFATMPFILLLSGKRMKAAVVYAFLYALAWLAEAFLVFNMTGIANILITMLSGLISRFIPCVVLGYYIVSTTRVGEFIAAMERMHVSRKIIIPLSVMFRFFPTVIEESSAISDAMRMRGITMKNIFNSPTAMLEYRMVPLMMSIVKIGDELSAAALTRGLGSPQKRTNICGIGFGVWDAVFALAITTALVFYIVF